MTFEEIFNQPGRYVADGFEKGVCFEVGEDGVLSTITYKDKNDLFPDKKNALMWKLLFTLDYRKALTRQSLFNDKTSDILDGKEFYNLMQAYRCADMGDQVNVIQKYENVKEWIRKEFI